MRAAKRIFATLLRQIAVAMVASAIVLSSASAEETLRVGKAVAQSFMFTMVDVGVAQGFFKKNGLDLQISAFSGDAALNQGMLAGAIDIGLAGGTNIGFAAKGAPVTAVGAMTNSSEWLGLIVPAHSPIKTVQDLKGKKVAVTGTSSLTYYVVKELSRRSGWGSDGIAAVSLGAPSAMYAAMKVGQVDALVSSVEGGYTLESMNEGGVLFTFGSNVGQFLSLAIFATNDLIKQRPDAVRKFLKGWYEAVAFMKTNKSQALPIANAVVKLPDQAASRIYDLDTKILSSDGKFSVEALHNTQASLTELGIIDKAAADRLKIDSLYTEKFLPSS